MAEQYKIALDELYRMIPQIEETRDKEGRGPGEREFTWIYAPGRQLKRQDAEDHASKHGIKHSTAVILPRDTNAVAMLHNHPSWSVHPSFEDIDTSLYCFSVNPEMKYTLIASTVKGVVRGFLSMRYPGSHSMAGAMRIAIGQMRDEVRRNKSELSESEQAELVRSAMEATEIEAEPVLLHGYKYKDWNFSV